MKFNNYGVSEIRCTYCKQVKTVNEFHNISKTLKHAKCKSCHAKNERERNHRLGIKKPMRESRYSPAFLGIYVAEQVLSKFFDNITRMPNNNFGYDFMCGKGFKIDVKSGCLIGKKPNARRTHWRFYSNRNKIADYFLCLAFDNRENLEPLHIWLIPVGVVNDRRAFNISLARLEIWKCYEKPLDRVLKCCDIMRDHPMEA